MSVAQDHDCVPTSSRVPLPLLILFQPIASGKKATFRLNTDQAKQAATPVTPVTSADEPPAPSNKLVLASRHTGDLDEMVER
jgi:hypothetical protein